jgi:tripartite-type tricarboxylate transporter receptor subunit TctC
MTVHRRQLLTLAGTAAGCLVVARSAWAQAYPARPVRLIVGFPPGGAADIVARLMAQWLSDRLGQQFIVENRPGAGTNIATEAVVRAPADGYTLLYATSPNVIAAALYEKLSFDFARDIAPVAGIIRAPLVMLVNPAFPATTVSEFIAYAKANPGKVNMASAGNGTPAHVAGELMKMMAGIEMVHVPYRGGAPAMTDLLGGQVQVYFSVLPEGIQYLKAGGVRALAITSSERWKALPEIPSLSEFLPGYEASPWHGLGAPKNTPAEIIGRLNAEVNSVLHDPKAKDQLVALGGEPMPMMPAEFGTFIAAETEKWGEVVRFSGAKAQ